MIQVQELRVGNLAQINNESRVKKRFIFDKVFIITSHDISQIGRGGNYPLEPIPLTEEWLLKFGFNKFAEQFRDLDSIYRLGYIDITYHTRYNKFHFHNIVIDSVHHLQNLYYALTKQELTINQP
jgi:hypothetical protein